MSEWRDVERVEDLDEGLLFQIEEMAVDWLGSPMERDWEGFLYKVEDRLHINLPGRMDHGVIRKIKTACRAAWKEANE